MLTLILSVNPNLNRLYSTVLLYIWRAMGACTPRACLCGLWEYNENGLVRSPKTIYVVRTGEKSMRGDVFQEWEGKNVWMIFAQPLPDDSDE
jgi:hypothetical protein